MNFIELKELKVGENRQRRIFEQKSIDDLANSILSKGLLHPIVLRDDKCTLVAGERRVRAIQKLYDTDSRFYCNGGPVPYGQIPFISISDLSADLVEEAELEENVIRKDLSWQERASAVARLHQLRERQAEARGEKQSMIKTAAEILGLPPDNTYSTNGGLVKNSLVLSKYLSDPEIASAPDERTAFKILRKRTDAEHRAVLAEEFHLRETIHDIRQGRAEDLLATLAPNTVDIIITDPPYGIGADTFGTQASATHVYEDGLDYALGCYQIAFQAAAYLTKKDAFLFTFCDIRVFPAIYTLAQRLLPDWKLWETPLIWDKMGNGMLPVPDRGPRRTYEAVFYAYKGGRRWNAIGTSDVMSVQPVAQPAFGAQKPVDLYLLLMSRVSFPGDTVLDPFAGTGPVVAAAKLLQCRAIAFELDKAKVDYILAKQTGDDE